MLHYLNIVRDLKNKIVINSIEFIEHNLSANYDIKIQLPITEKLFKYTIDPSNYISVQPPFFQGHVLYWLWGALSSQIVHIGSVRTQEEDLAWVCQLAGILQEMTFGLGTCTGCVLVHPYLPCGEPIRPPMLSVVVNFFSKSEIEIVNK